MQNSELQPDEVFEGEYTAKFEGLVRRRGPSLSLTLTTAEGHQGHLEQKAHQAGRRGPHMKLGFALQLVTVRYVGLFLEDPLDVPSAVLEFVAGQMDIADPSCVKRYTERAKTPCFRGAAANGKPVRTVLAGQRPSAQVTGVRRTPPPATAGSSSHRVGLPE